MGTHARTYATRRWRGMLYGIITLLVLAIWAGAAGVCRAQFSSVESPEQLVTGQRTNLFVTWEGETDIDGLLVELPSGWTLRGASALRYGWEKVPLTVRRRGSGTTVRYVVEASRLLHGPHEFVLRVAAEGLSGRSQWRLEPFVYEQSAPTPLSGYEVRRSVRMRSSGTGTNQVLAFAQGRGEPLVLSETVLPALSARTDYTLAFWLRTTGLDEIVFTTWDGDEQQAYPLELVIDAAGRLAVYRGQPGRHEALVTRRRVADGTWHHVAVTHQSDAPDGEGGWHLYLDGASVDSLPPAEAFSSQVPGLALGARLSGGASSDRRMAFTGALDELTLLPQALAPAALKRHMDEPVEPGEEGVLLTFDEEIDERLLVRRTERVERRRTERVRDEGRLRLKAFLDDTDVELAWQMAPGAEGDVVVERSTDGASFEVVASLSRSDAARVDADGTVHFSWMETDVEERVVYYRVRHLREDGGELEASTIKVGLGRARDQQDMLVGNFPNPFNSFTTISYELPETEQIQLAVWDLSGHQVALLVDEVQSAGLHEVRFTPGDLPSGTYFARLRTPTRDDTHKMILMK